MPVIGFLNSGAAQAFAHLAGAFRMGLGEIGYVEDENVAIEYRWANGQYNRLPELAADLIGRQVAIIAAGGPPAARAAKAATSIVPIVFTSGDDPVQAGFVSSLNRPGGNITGVHLLITELNAKKLGLLRDLLPQVKGIAALLNPTSQNAEIQSDELQTAGRALGLQIDDELEFGGPQHWQVRGPLALENATHIDADLTIGIPEAGAIGYEPTLGILAKIVDCGDGMACCQRDNLFTTNDEKRIVADHERTD